MTIMKLYGVERGQGLQCDPLSGSPRLFRSKSLANQFGKAIPIRVTLDRVTVSAKKASSPPTKTK